MSHADKARRPGAILIAGPTASGKSALALRLAARLGGRIINADSMQVYRDLSILTARPSEADMAQVAHRLYGTVDGAETYSVSRWLVDVAAELASAKADGTLPIVVGGTGLYFKALTQGLSEIPPVPAQVRADLRAWAEGRAAEALHAELARRDPLMAQRLRPTDPQRILRALEIHAATGESLATFQDRRGPPVVEPGTALAMTLAVDREVLRRRIDRRTIEMFASDALAEAERLAARGLDPAMPIMRAIGLPQTVAYAAGRSSMTEAVESTTAASRQYVKRQETFFRHQLNAFRSVPADAAEALLVSAYS